MVSGMEIEVFRDRNPAAIGRGSFGAEFVCESMGVFTAKEKAELLSKGARRR